MSSKSSVIAPVLIDRTLRDAEGRKITYRLQLGETGLAIWPLAAADVAPVGRISYAKLYAMSSKESE